MASDRGSFIFLPALILQLWKLCESWNNRFVYLFVNSFFIFSEGSAESGYVPGSFSSKARSKYQSVNSGAVLAANFDKSVLQVLWRPNKWSLCITILHHFLIFRFQISDWLNLEQNMLKNQHVEVGNLDAISEAIDKQKVNGFSFTTVLNFNGDWIGSFTYLKFSKSSVNWISRNRSSMI